MLGVRLGANVRRPLLLVFALFVLFLVLSGPAAAQQSPSDSTSTTAAPSAAAPQIVGRLVSGTKPVEGVRLTANAVSVPAGPGFEGEATSDADGNWAIPVPGPGIYRVAIDRSTIPDGFALENADRYQLPRFQMFPGATVRNAVFAFQGNAAGGIEVPTRLGAHHPVVGERRAVRPHHRRVLGRIVVDLRHDGPRELRGR